MVPIICFLRGVNVGGHGKINMAQLKKLFEDLQFADVHTVLQSGNVVFSAKRASLSTLTRTITNAITQEFGFTPDVILRTPTELKTILAQNPFPQAADRDPSHLLVMFLAGASDPQAHTKLTALSAPAERFEIGEREVYFYYANSMAKTKLGGPALEKALGARGTMRNWNTIRKLLEIAENGIS